MLVFLKNGPIPAFLVYFSPFIIKTEKYKLKKHKCCSWGSNRNGHKMVSTNGTTELYGGFCIQYCHTYNVNEFLAAKTWEERWKEWKERYLFWLWWKCEGLNLTRCCDRRQVVRPSVLGEHQFRSETLSIPPKCTSRQRREAPTRMAWIAFVEVNVQCCSFLDDDELMWNVNHKKVFLPQFSFFRSVVKVDKILD